MATVNLLKNNWSDEARAASLAVRRANALERRRQRYFEENPNATEHDWEREQKRREQAQRDMARQRMVERARRKFFKENPHLKQFSREGEIAFQVYEEMRLQDWRRERDRERWEEENPEGTELDWLEHLASGEGTIWQQEREIERKKEWRKQKELPRRYNEPFVNNWESRGADGAVVPSWYDEENGELIELPREAWPDHLRRDNRLKEGEVLDPHWGDWSEDAPYGYNDETGEPRTEPLYNADGYPIVPIRPDINIWKRPDGRGRVDWGPADMDAVHAMNDAEKRYQDAIQE